MRNLNNEFYESGYKTGYSDGVAQTKDSLETELKEWKVKCAFLEKRVKELDGVVERTQPFIDHELMMRKVFEEKAKSLTARIAEMSEALKQVVECGAGCEHCYIYAKDALSKSRPTNQNKVKP